MRILNISAAGSGAKLLGEPPSKGVAMLRAQLVRQLKVIILPKSPYAAAPVTGTAHVADTSASFELGYAAGEIRQK